MRQKFGGRLKLVVSGSAALSKEVAEFIDALGIEVYEGYGLTETAPVISVNTPAHRKIGSVGKPLAGVRVVIDTQQNRITYIGDDFEARALGFDPKLAAARANPFALERIRYYKFETDGTLTLSTRYDDGKEAAASQWKRE